MRRVNLDDSRFGRRLDSSRRVGFTFDRRLMSGFAGDTAASALCANGARVLARSFKHHRPRGISGFGREEANALLSVGEGGRLNPNVRAGCIELREGMSLSSQNCWPSPDVDVGALISRGSALIPSGFYYKTFMRPRGMWLRVYEPLIRRLAGLGRAPSSPDPDRYEHVHAHCDVLIVGGGLSGLAAALAAQPSGAKIMLVEDDVELGGGFDLFDGQIDGASLSSWRDRATATLASADNVLILTRCAAVGRYDHGWHLLDERVVSDDPDAPRHRMWKVRAPRTILACGDVERPIAFAHNDRPGILSSRATRAMLRRWGVAMGDVAASFAADDDAYRTLLDLLDAGVEVSAAIDPRPEGGGELAERARARGVEILNGARVAEAHSSRGGRRLVGATIERAGGGRRRIECDVLAVCGGRTPSAQLAAHAGSRPTWNSRSERFDFPSASDSDSVDSAAFLAGSADGLRDLGEAIERSWELGALAARHALERRGRASFESPSPPSASEDVVLSASEPIYAVDPALSSRPLGDKHFLDLQNDVSLADVRLAAREGYSSPEHAKRYTTLGMATDQGRTSSALGLAALSEATGGDPEALVPTSFRPPTIPIPFGAICGERVGCLYEPLRRTAMDARHEEDGASFEMTGGWRRPWSYPSDGESRESASRRESEVVRRAVGLLDASTLGKIEVKGPDAAELLDRLYVNVMSSLGVGRCRYGVMMNEEGYVFDDGVVARLGDDHFLLHTTSGGADSVASWLEEWLQTEWHDLRAFIVPVTEQWAQIVVAGPDSRRLLDRAGCSIDLSDDSFPFMTMREGRVASIECRVFRISFSGELSYEIAVAADRGEALWSALRRAGEPLGACPYGTEAMHVLRAEKGYVIVGDETDGTVNPLDLGMDRMVSRKKADFVGKRSLALSDHLREDRWRLTGILPDDPSLVLPDGAHAVSLSPSPSRLVGSSSRRSAARRRFGRLPSPDDSMPPETFGFVTSSYFSPTLDRGFALALIEDGARLAEMGGKVMFSLADGRIVSTTATSPIFLDPEGERPSVSDGYVFVPESERDEDRVAHVEVEGVEGVGEAYVPSMPSGESETSGGCRVSALRGTGMLELRGRDDDSEFMEKSSRGIGLDLPTESFGSVYDSSRRMHCLRLSSDQWLLRFDGESGVLESERVLSSVRKSLGDVSSSLAVDVSSSRTIFRVEGSWNRSLLMKGTSTDLFSSSCVAGWCRRASLSEQASLLHVPFDVPEAVDVYVFRSYARFAAEWLLEAGRFEPPGWRAR